MVFVPALTTFVISNLLGGSKILLIGNVIEQEFTKSSNWNLGSGLSLVLSLIHISIGKALKYRQEVRTTFLLPLLSSVIMGAFALAVYRLTTSIDVYKRQSSGSNATTSSW